MATAITSTSSLGTLLHDLEAVAYQLVAGRARQHDAAALVGAVVRQQVRGGSSLLHVLETTAPRLDDCAVARKKFFHATRALVTLHRA